MAQYACPDCNETLTDQGLFGRRGERFRRFRCDNQECYWEGTSYPESSLIARLARAAV